VAAKSKKHSFSKLAASFWRFLFSQTVADGHLMNAPDAEVLPDWQGAPLCGDGDGGDARRFTNCGGMAV
jgi:hypothetical protein